MNFPKFNRQKKKCKPPSPDPIQANSTMNQSSDSTNIFNPMENKKRRMAALHLLSRNFQIHFVPSTSGVLIGFHEPKVDIPITRSSPQQDIHSSPDKDFLRTKSNRIRPSQDQIRHEAVQLSIAVRDRSTSYQLQI